MLTQINQPWSKVNWIILCVILAISAWLRLYNLENSQQFLGDQGRDSLVVSRIFTQNDLVFIGPVTSVGNMYLGPLYYYFMLPWLWLTYPSPMGPIYAVAVLGILTVGLLYYLGRELVGERAAMIGAALMGISATVVLHSRFSWNPNPAPLVSLLMIWCVYRALTQNWKYWWGAALGFSVLIQLHYLTLLSAGGAGFVWLWQLANTQQLSKKQQLWWLKRLIPTSWRLAKTPNLKQHSLAVVGSVIIQVISLLPLMLFDLKHNGLNQRAFTTLFSTNASFTVSTTMPWDYKIKKTIKEMHGRTLRILFEYNLGKYRLINTVLSVAILTLLVKLLSPGNRRATFYGEVVLVAFLFTSIFGTALYQHTVFDHYLAYLFPVTFLVYGVALNWLWEWSSDRIGRWFGPTLMAVVWVTFLLLNLKKYPLQSVNWTINQMMQTAHSISEQLKPEEKYGIVLLSETKDLYGMNYRYLLSTTAHPPLSPEQIGQAEALVIINEQHLAQPINTQIYEIAVFPHKQVSQRFTLEGGPEIVILRK